MGLFSNKKVAEENEFEGATKWFKAQEKTAKDFNDEDNKMAEQDTQKQARIFIAIEKTRTEETLQFALRRIARKL